MPVFLFTHDSFKVRNTINPENAVKKRSAK